MEYTTVVTFCHDAYPPFPVFLANDDQPKLITEVVVSFTEPGIIGAELASYHRVNGPTIEKMMISSSST